MKVEIEQDGTWIEIADATAVPLGTNQYEVTFPGSGRSLRSLDNTKLRVDGQESRQVVGTRRTNEALTVAVLV